MKNKAYFLALAWVITSVAWGTSIEGVWRTNDKERNAFVKIEPCGSPEGTYCGKIIKLQKPTYPEGDEEAGKPKRDRDNENEELRDRPLEGLQILSGLTKEGDKYVEGQIYSPKNGKTYHAEAWMKDDGKTLVLKGYIQFLMFTPGEEREWTRVKESDGFDASVASKGEARSADTDASADKGGEE